MSRARGASSRATRVSSWPLGAYLALLVALFVLAAGAAAVYVDVQTRRDARAEALADARSAARTAAEQLGDFLALARTSVDQLAANPQIPQLLEHPEACSLAYAGLGGRDRGHLDILRADGTVACSSRKPSGGRGYAGERWLRQALQGPTFVAPRRDSATGSWVAITAAPLQGAGGVVAAFTDLAAAGPTLLSLYGGGDPLVFLVTTADRRRVIARSLRPERWIGAALAGASVTRADAAERRDLDDRTRLYAEAEVAGVGWRLLAGADEDAALAAGRRLERRQFAIIGVGLLAVLLAAWFVHRSVVSPIRRLGNALRASSGAELAPVPVAGPVEISTLGEDVNALIASVDRELRERTRAEEAARASERNYRLLFESNPNPMWVFDAETLRFLAVNDAAVRAYGWSREEFLGLTIEDIRPPGDVGELRGVVTGAGSTERGFNLAGIWRHRRKDGTILEAEITSHAHRFEGRDARVVLAVDVTERLTIERQLRQVQRLEAIGRLAGGVAHDFNNLLTVIRGYADALLEDGEQGSRTEVSEIAAAAGRATVLTRQLLAFSRQQVLQPRPVDLNEIVEGVLPMLARLVGEDVELVTALAPKVHTAVADPHQLEQVLVNLVVNARDAMPEGGTLTVQTANADLDAEYVAQHAEATVGPHAMLAVSDTGIGMDAETLSHIFEPFFTTKPVGSGTGLGLSTSYGIVRQTGGTIWVYSEPGKGTTFKVYLPLAAGRSPSQPEAHEPVALDGTETVLVAEDEEALRTLIGVMLEPRGYVVLAAATAEEALRIAEERGSEIDLVLTDLVMPRIGGRELAALIRERVPGVAVLYMSGYADEVVARSGALEPGAAFVEKPFSANDLARKVREALDAAGRIRAPRRRSP